MGDTCCILFSLKFLLFSWGDTYKIYLLEDTSLCCILKPGINRLHCTSSRISRTCGLLPLRKNLPFEDEVLYVPTFSSREICHFRRPQMEPSKIAYGHRVTYKRFQRGELLSLGRFVLTVVSCCVTFLDEFLCGFECFLAYIQHR